jgi:hypothetical protein
MIWLWTKNLSIKQTDCRHSFNVLGSHFQNSQPTAERVLEVPEVIPKHLVCEFHEVEGANRLDLEVELIYCLGYLVQHAVEDFVPGEIGQETPLDVPGLDEVSQVSRESKHG